MPNSEVLRLGPFVRGLNRAADPVVVEDEELTECLNLELDIDGSLVNRSPITALTEENEPLMTGDISTFESGIGTWVNASNSVLAHSTLQAHTGTGSMSVTSVTSVTDMLCKHLSTAQTLQGLPIIAGETYRVRGWFRANTTNRQCQFSVEWFQSDGTSISIANVGASVADSSAAWTEQTGTVVAPALAALATIRARIQAPGSAGEIHFIDDVTVARFINSDNRFLLFGSVELSDVFYIFATRNGQTFVSDDLTETWTELAPGALSRECVCMEVFSNAGVPTVWLPATPGSANGGISWTPAGGPVAVAAMPRGVNCVVHKNRLYVVPGQNATSNESRLTFSEAADFTTWPGTDFIDVSAGDGTTLVNLTVYQDNLLLFKEDSTFLLAYDLDPADAVLREINPVVGSTGHFGVTQHENVVYCLHNANVYEIVNFNFGLLNLKVPLEFENSLPVGTSIRHEDQHVSLLGTRLVVRYFNRTYVLGLRTRAWSEWRKTDDSSSVEWHIFGPLVRGPLDLTTNEYIYFTSYSFTMNNDTGWKIFKVVSKLTAGDTEGFGSHNMFCIATTKHYDMADPLRFKRLFWWGADLISGNEIIADVVPITLGFGPTWDELGDNTWDDLNTWNSLLTVIPSTQTIIPQDNVFDTSKFIKFQKSLRFRKITFSVQLVTNGTTTQINKIFSYIVVVRTKQVVSSQVS